MPLTSKEKSQALRNRRAEAGLKELRNVWVSDAEEKALRPIIKAAINDMRGVKK